MVAASPLNAAHPAAAPAYASQLLQSLGLRSPRPLAASDEHPALAWARSGLMHLTGPRHGPGLMCPAPLASCADGALAALACLGQPGAFPGWRGSQLLGERAAITGDARQGAVSPGGDCRLLEAADGFLALNLPRDDDWTLLPAWLERDEAPGDWAGVAEAVRPRRVADLVERARLLGLAAAPDGAPVAPADWVAVSESGRSRRSGLRRAGASWRNTEAPLVVELASLWAGPLCGHLLQRLGAEVVKVESPDRPDGARAGPPAFCDLLNAGKASVALDLASAPGRAQLRDLLLRADIVIEGSRPRALRQMGIEAQAILEDNPPLTWVSITGYGREPGVENHAAYGDDAGVAAGLSHLMHEATGERMICGDAIADPLTGLHAALAAWGSFRSGGGRLVGVSLRDVVGHCLSFGSELAPADARARQQEWTALAGQSGGAARPRARSPLGAARPLGADTAAVLQRLHIA